MSDEVTEKKSAKDRLDELWKTEEWRKLDRILKKIPIHPSKNVLSTATPPVSLKTNTIFDDLCGGGLRRGQLLEMYGNFASGKTQICFTFTVECEGKIVWIDTEGTFSTERVKGIALARNKDISSIDERLLYYNPMDYREQMAVTHQLPNVDQIDLIIVDSLLAHFTSEKDFIGREKLTVRQGMIRSHLADLRHIAKKYKAIVIITNQIRQTPDAKPYTPMYMLEMGVGGPSVHHVPDTIIYLRKAKDPLRIARLMDSSEIASGERPFIINEKGIDNVPQEKQDEEKPEEEKTKDEQPKTE